MSERVQVPDDVVIVGGGVYGASAALEFVERGWRVRLLEAGELASGASGGPGERGVRSLGRDVREVPAFARAIERWVHLEETLPGGVGFRQIGSLMGYEQRFGDRLSDVRGRLEAHAQALTTLGVPVEVLDAEQIHEREPSLSKGVLGGLYSPVDGVCDHTRATRSLAAAAERLGASVREHARVERVDVERGRAVAVVLESGERVEVPGHLLLLCNTGVPDLVGPHLDDTEHLPTWAENPLMVYVSNPTGAVIHHLFGHVSRKLAVKQLPDGTIMLSGGYTVERDADGGIVGALSGLSANLADALQVFPVLEQSELLASAALRFESYTADDTAIVGRPAKVDNLTFGFGWTGHGFAISVGMTQMITDWITTGTRHDDLAVFDHARFTRVS